MSDRKFQELLRNYRTGDKSNLRRLIYVAFRSGVVNRYADLLGIIDALDVYRTALRWPEMTQEDLDEFFRFMGVVSGVIHDMYTVTSETASRLGENPYVDVDIDALYQYTYSWDIERAPYMNSDITSIQIQLNFSLDQVYKSDYGHENHFIDDELTWEPIMYGPWFLSIWVVYDREMHDLGDPSAYWDEAVPLRSNDTYINIEEALNQLNQITGMG